MRLKIECSGDHASGQWMARIPEVNFENMDPYIDADGRLKTSEVATTLARFPEHFMQSSDESYNSYAFTVEFIRRLRKTMGYLEDSDESEAHVGADDTPEDRRMSRRLNKGQTAFARIDIRGIVDGVRFAINFANPKETIIGQPEIGAREFAIFVARIIYTIKEDADRRNERERERNPNAPQFRVDLTSKDPTLVSEAIARELHGRETDRIREANDRHHACRCRCGSGETVYCSPSHPRCKFYVDGFCRDLPLPPLPR